MPFVTRAFALITVAVENTPDSERVWIEDIYHIIFCGAPAGTRNQAQGMVADWRQRYGRTANNTTRSTLGRPGQPSERTCPNGEKVVPLPERAPAENSQGGTPTTSSGATVLPPR